MKTPIRHSKYAADNFPKFIVVHHSGGTDANVLEDTSHHTAEIVRAWHLKKAWDDIGYHVVIERSGRVVLGRPYDYHGAHASGIGNKDSVGVMLTGNFDRNLSSPNSVPSPEQIKAVKDWYAKGVEEFYMFDKDGKVVPGVGRLQAFIERYPDITPSKVYPHRKFQVKTCYGLNLKDDYFAKLFLEAMDEAKNPAVEACRAEVEKLNRQVEAQSGIMKQVLNTLRTFMTSMNLGAPVTMEGTERKPTVSEALGEAMMSSVNPQELSLTVKSTLLALVPTVVTVIKIFGIDALDENFLKDIIEGLANVVMYGGYLISAAGIVWGLLRKAWVALTK